MIRNKIKQYIARVVVMIALLAFVVQSVVPMVHAETTDTWIDGRLPVLADIAPQTYPKTCYSGSLTYQSFTTYNNEPSNVIRNIEQPVCVSGFGSSLRLGSSTGSDVTADFVGVGYGYRILESGGTPISFGRVPNQDIFTYGYYTGQIIYGASTSLAIGYSFARHGSFGNYLVRLGSSSRNEMAYKLTSPPQPLRDTNGRVLDFRENRRFSSNGEWMIAEVAGVGIIRVNMLTQQMQVIDPSYRPLYDQGWVPYIGLAITNDGNTALVGQKAFDLSGCAQVSPTFNGSTSAIAGCRTRNLSDSLASQLRGFDAFYDLRFSGDGMQLRGRAAYYNSLGVRTLKWVTYSVYGYQPKLNGYIALGDSFSSGEGAYNYEPATDSGSPRNRCHVSKDSYPYLAASSTGLTDFHSVACSGAETMHYFSKFQYDNIDNFSWVQGEDPQSDYLIQGRPNIVTISMIGNDIGFSDKLTWCAVRPDSCYHFKEDRQALAGEIQDTFGKLTKLYKRIKDTDAPGAKVYVLGYPQLFGTGTDCGLTATFDQEERLMSRGLITYLNSVIRAATENAGVVYIDVENAFAGHRICESGEKAVNGLRADAPHWSWSKDILPVAMESFHPNKLGHQLMTEALLAQSGNFTYDMPVPDDAKKAPGQNSYAYNELISTAPSSGQFLSRQVYVAQATVDKATKFSPIRIINDGIFKAGSKIRAVFRSEPVYAGEIIADENGNINGEVTVPADLPPGYHTLHLLGQDIAGEPIDAYKVVYVAASENDIDGDGIPNDQEKCLVVEPSGQDYDRDGIDDACDGEVTEPPKDVLAPIVAGTPDGMPNANDWYNADVNIAWSSTDPDPSSGVPTQPIAIKASEEGEHVYTSEQSCDPAANCSTGSISLKIDKTRPTIDFSVTPLRSSGWSNQTTTVTFNCSDAVSGVEFCSEPVEVSTEGTTIVMGSTRDKAGNTSEIAAFISIDKTAPTLGAMQWDTNTKSVSSTANAAVSFIENLSGFEKAEYYIGDVDPGLGNGAPMNVDDHTATIKFGTDFSVGVYKITARVQDKAGNWSAPVGDYLVVYDPNGPRFMGNKMFTPSTDNGDLLPQLGSGPDAMAKFAFSVRYGSDGKISKNSDLQFKYVSDVRCGSKLINNCHHLDLDATSIEWMVTQGEDGSAGMFQGNGIMKVDGKENPVIFRVQGLDGERKGLNSDDQFALQIFEPDANPNTDVPIYRVSKDLAAHGIIKIYK